MKKSTLILIIIIYIASIPIINLFGMNVKLYNEKVNVSHIECLNETDENCEVSESNGKKILKVKFTEKADPVNLTGTMLQLTWRVAPDNATKKDVTFNIKGNKSRIEMFKDAEGNETGLILFSGKAMVDIDIMSTDGTKVYTTVLVWAY